MPDGSTQAQGSPYTRKLTARFLFVEAARTLRDRFGRILAVAAVIALAAALLDSAFDLVLENLRGQVIGLIATIAVGMALLVSGANSFGATFLSGLLDRTVGEHQHGLGRLSLAQVFLTLPWLTLIGADLLVTLMRGVGWVLLVIPGLVVMTLTAVVGPVVIIEQRRAWSAIKRSTALTRPVFWLVFRAVTIPLLFETGFDELVKALPFTHGFVNHLLAAVFLEVPILVYVSLIEVTLAYHLVERDRPGTIAAAHH